MPAEKEPFHGGNNRSRLEGRGKPQSPQESKKLGRPRTVSDEGKKASQKNYNRRYYQEHRADIREDRRRFISEHREKLKQKNKEYQRLFRKRRKEAQHGDLQQQQSEDVQIFPLPPKKQQKRGRPRIYSDEERVARRLEKAKRYYQKHKDAALGRNRKYRQRIREEKVGKEPNEQEQREGIQIVKI